MSAEPRCCRARFPAACLPRPSIERRACTRLCSGQSPGGGRAGCATATRPRCRSRWAGHTVTALSSTYALPLLLASPAPLPHVLQTRGLTPPGRDHDLRVRGQRTRRWVRDAVRRIAPRPPRHLRAREGARRHAVWRRCCARVMARRAQRCSSRLRRACCRYVLL